MVSFRSWINPLPASYCLLLPWFLVNKVVGNKPLQTFWEDFTFHRIIVRYHKAQPFVDFSARFVIVVVAFPPLLFFFIIFLLTLVALSLPFPHLYLLARYSNSYDRPSIFIHRHSRIHSCKCMSCDCSLVFSPAHTCIWNIFCIEGFFRDIQLRWPHITHHGWDLCILHKRSCHNLGNWLFNPRWKEWDLRSLGWGTAWIMGDCSQIEFFIFFLTFGGPCAKDFCEIKNLCSRVFYSFHLGKLPLINSWVFTLREWRCSFDSTHDRIQRLFEESLVR